MFEYFDAVACAHMICTMNIYKLYVIIDILTTTINCLNTSISSLPASITNDKDELWNLLLHKQIHQNSTNIAFVHSSSVSPTPPHSNLPPQLASQPPADVFGAGASDNGTTNAIDITDYDYYENTSSSATSSLLSSTIDVTTADDNINENGKNDGDNHDSDANDANLPYNENVFSNVYSNDKSYAAQLNLKIDKIFNLKRNLSETQKIENGAISKLQSLEETFSNDEIKDVIYAKDLNNSTLRWNKTTNNIDTNATTIVSSEESVTNLDLNREHSQNKNSSEINVSNISLPLSDTNNIHTPDVEIMFANRIHNNETNHAENYTTPTENTLKEVALNAKPAVYQQESNGTNWNSENIVNNTKVKREGTVQIVKISETVFSEEDSSLESYEETDSKPRSNPIRKPGQTSLVIVFDGTGSMENCLIQLRSGAKQIIKKFAKREDNPIYNYVFVPFRDPCK